MSPERHSEDEGDTSPDVIMDGYNIGSGSGHGGVAKKPDSSYRATQIGFVKEALEPKVKAKRRKR